MGSRYINQYGAGRRAWAREMNRRPASVSTIDEAPLPETWQGDYNPDGDDPRRVYEDIDRRALARREERY